MFSANLYYSQNMRHAVSIIVNGFRHHMKTKLIYSLLDIFAEPIYSYALLALDASLLPFMFPSML